MYYKYIRSLLYCKKSKECSNTNYIVLLVPSYILVDCETIVNMKIIFAYRLSLKYIPNILLVLEVSASNGLILACL